MNSYNFVVCTKSVFNERADDISIHISTDVPKIKKLNNNIFYCLKTKGSVINPHTFILDILFYGQKQKLTCVNAKNQNKLKIYQHIRFLKNRPTLY